MKKLLVLLVSGLIPLAASAQEVNYRALKPTTNHLVSAHIGADYGTYYGLSYGYVLSTRWRPVVIGTEAVLPFGNEVEDDWKWTVTAQTELLHAGHFSLAVKPSFSLRRYESPLANLSSLAGGVSVTAGYAKPRWGVVFVVGYDKPLATRIENVRLREYYPGIRDGWYNSSGGNVKAGVRAHLAIRSCNTFLAVGKAFGQDFKDNPTLPFFMELSVQRPLVR